MMFLSDRNGIVRATLSRGGEVEIEELPEGALVQHSREAGIRQHNPPG
jgi:hypothetical protein